MLTAWRRNATLEAHCSCGGSGGEADGAVGTLELMVAKLTDNRSSVKEKYQDIGLFTAKTITQPRSADHCLARQGRPKPFATPDRPPPRMPWRRRCRGRRR